MCYLCMKKLFNVGNNTELFFEKTLDGNLSTKMAIERPDDFVMKPQREGGG